VSTYILQQLVSIGRERLIQESSPSRKTEKLADSLNGVSSKVQAGYIWEAGIINHATARGILLRHHIVIACELLLFVIGLKYAGSFDWRVGADT
jgi:hypothetical protein